MATYKLMQDIEAEDHILGPLTLRQFLFGLTAIFFGYLCFIAITKHVVFLLALFAPPMLFCLFFAIPFGGDQPTEIWALAKLRFWFKPRKRIWNQSGMKELVTITVPKKIEHVFTDGLSETEVKSRLKALANTLDSRGWAVKNVDVNAFVSRQPVMAGQSSDRLIDIGAMPHEVQSIDVPASADMLESNSPISQQFEHMITESAQTHRQQIVAQMNAPAPTPPATAPASQTPPADYWFMNQATANSSAPSNQATFTPQVLQPRSAPQSAIPHKPTVDEAALSAHLKAKSDKQTAPDKRMHTLQPLSRQAPPAPIQPQPIASPPTPDPAILSLANNDDLNVATIAREASKQKNGEGPMKEEVVISLH
jgi:hypothetical protein